MRFTTPPGALEHLSEELGAARLAAAHDRDAWFFAAGIAKALAALGLVNGTPPQERAWPTWTATTARGASATTAPPSRGAGTRPPNGVDPGEVGTRYLRATDRFVVAMVVGWPAAGAEGGAPQVPVTGPQQALRLTLEELGSDGGVLWTVFDRATGTLHQLEQRASGVVLAAQEGDDRPAER
jgi:hypothetical protein